MALTDLVSIPEGINQDVRNARQATMLALLGNPRDSYDQECREMTNPRLAQLMTTDRAGPLHVRGLRPAVESLKQVVADIQSREPEVFRCRGEKLSERRLCAIRRSSHATVITQR